MSERGIAILKKYRKDGEDRNISLSSSTVSDVPVSRLLVMWKKISQLKVITCYMQPNANLTDGFGKLLQMFMNLQPSRVSGNSETRIDQLRHKQNMEREGCHRKTRKNSAWLLGIHWEH